MSDDKETYVYTKKEVFDRHVTSFEMSTIFKRCKTKHTGTDGEEVHGFLCGRAADMVNAIVCARMEGHFKGERGLRVEIDSVDDMERMVVIGKKSKVSTSIIDMTDKTEVEMVNHPKHYNTHPSGVECIEITRHMGSNLGNVMKYVWGDEKGKAIEDLEKAEFYLKDEIKKLKRHKHDGKTGDVLIRI